MEENLSLQEIEARYPNEWVLIEDPETTDALELIRGRVISHSLNRDEMDLEALKRKMRSSAVIFTGPVVPEGTAALL